MCCKITLVGFVANLLLAHTYPNGYMSSAITRARDAYAEYVEITDVQEHSSITWHQNNMKWILIGVTSREKYKTDENSGSKYLVDH